MLQTAHDSGFVALDMTLLNRGHAFVEPPLAAAHAFGRLCHCLALSLQCIGSSLQPLFLLLVLLVFKLLEAPFPFLLGGPVGVISVKNADVSLVQFPYLIADPV